MPTYLAVTLAAAVAVVGITAIWLLLSPPNPAGSQPRHAAGETPPAPAGPQRSMYERLGAGGIRAAVDQFYHRALGDPMLAPYFGDLTPEGLSRLHRHQALLIGQVLGGPKTFELHELAIAHRRLHITPDAYWRTVGHLAAVLAGLDVDKDIVMHLLDALFDMQELIVTDGPVLAGRTA